MAQPEYVPIDAADRVRPAERLPSPDSWRPDRPGDLVQLSVPDGDGFGSPGPDPGYGLKLARRFVDRLELAEGERAEDAMAGCFAVGAKRAALFGRAPVVFDMELAYTLWGFLGGAPGGLVAYRQPLFASAAHHYWDQRAICDRVPGSTLRLTPAQVRDRLSDWKSLLKVDTPHR